MVSGLAGVPGGVCHLPGEGVTRRCVGSGTTTCYRCVDRQHLSGPRDRSGTGDARFVVLELGSHHAASGIPAHGWRRWNSSNRSVALIVAPTRRVRGTPSWPMSNGRLAGPDILGGDGKVDGAARRRRGGHDVRRDDDQQSGSRHRRPARGPRHHPCARRLRGVAGRDVRTDCRPPRSSSTPTIRPSRAVAERFAVWLRRSTGFALPVVGEPGDGDIVLTVDDPPPISAPRATRCTPTRRRAHRRRHAGRRRSER